MDVGKRLSSIQKGLKVPKGQYNKHGNFYYRNQEDILEAIKPLLGDASLTISDELVPVGADVYVKATVTLIEDGKPISVSAYAREAVEQKGMSVAQITGSTSSYARKYALNGLFLCDDTKDDDTRPPQGASNKTGADHVQGSYGSQTSQKAQEEEIPEPTHTYEAVGDMLNNGGLRALVKEHGFKFNGQLKSWRMEVRHSKEKEFIEAMMIDGITIKKI